VNEIRELGVDTRRLKVGLNSMWTMRATARLRRPDGGPSDVIRSASATVKYWPVSGARVMPVQIVRYSEDAWSQFAITPGSVQ
jgi:hypothetical protein